MEIAHRDALFEYVHDNRVCREQGRLDLLLLRIVRADSRDEAARCDVVAPEEPPVRRRAGDDDIAPAR